VITWDSDAPKSQRACFYGVDNVKGGQKQADIMNRLLDGKNRQRVDPQRAGVRAEPARPAARRQDEPQQKPHDRRHDLL
jgi:ABC-type sugar transport system substrate-binding protein